MVVESQMKFPKPDDVGRLIPDQITPEESLLEYWQMIPMFLDGLQFSINNSKEGRLLSWIEFTVNTMRGVDYLTTIFRPLKTELTLKVYKSLVKIWETFFLYEHVQVRGDQRLAFQKLGELLLDIRNGKVNDDILIFGIPYDEIEITSVGDVTERVDNRTNLGKESMGLRLHFENFIDNWKTVLLECRTDLLDCLASIREEIESDDGTVPQESGSIYLRIGSKENPTFKYTPTYEVWRLLQHSNMGVFSWGGSWVCFEA